MNDYCEPNIAKGDTYRVIFVDDEHRALTVKSLSGSIAIISGLNGELPLRGAVILVGNDVGEAGWLIMPETIWPSSNAIAVICSILDDKRVVVDSNYTIKALNNPQNFDVKPGNTIEYDDLNEIIGILSEKPIKSRIIDENVADTADSYLYEKAVTGFTFDDFGGYPEVVSRARELIKNQLENRPFLDAMKVRPIRGILLTGPPGTGKTFLARIIAQESQAKFFLVNGPTVVSKWLGETENTLRKIFDAAKKSEKGAIIFFDEIDSIAADRSGDTHEASKKLVAQLLTLMDGFDENDGNIIVIAATNRADSLDPAIRRPGRFDWEIEFGLPTMMDRFEILQKSIARHTATADLPIAEVVERTDRWAAAELALIIAEAGQIAASDKRREISAEDFAQGYERVAAKIAKNLNRGASNDLA